MQQEVLLLADIMAIYNRRKFVDDPMTWGPANNITYRQCILPVLDEDGATIPGLTLEIKYRQGLVVDDCKYTFTLFQYKNKIRARVYQIEVVPPDQQSHTEPGQVLFGPHYHFGELYQVKELHEHLGCPDFEQWFSLFCERASIIFSGRVGHPTAHHLPI